MLVRSTQTHRTLSVQTFGVVLPSLVIESVSDPDQPNQLRLHTWDGRKATTAHTTTYRGCTYTSAPIPEGLSKAVRFAVASKPFESTGELVASMREFLCGHAHLAQNAAALLIRSDRKAPAVAFCVSMARPNGRALCHLHPNRQNDATARKSGSPVSECCFCISASAKCPICRRRDGHVFCAQPARQSGGHFEW